MQLALIINSVVCVLGAIGGFFFAAGSVISIANMKVPWRGALLVAALLVPVTFVVSGVGAWMVSPQMRSAFFALPWAYGLLFVLAMLFSFKR
jgi:hypothetical protein